MDPIRTLAPAARDAAGLDSTASRAAAAAINAAFGAGPSRAAARTAPQQATAHVVPLAVTHAALTRTTSTPAAGGLATPAATRARQTSESPLEGVALAMCRAILDQLAFGIVIVSTTGQIVLANRAAEREMASRRFVALEDGRIAGPGRAAILQALDEALSGLRQIVPISEGDDVLPVMAMPVCFGDGDATLAMLVFGRRNLCDPLVTEMYARARSLTSAETAVLRGLGEGCSPKECSERGGVAMSTVRTHLSSAREKIGVGSIDELLHVIGCLPPTAPALFGYN